MVWWWAIPIGAYAAKKIYEVITEDDSSSSSSSYDYEQRAREEAHEEKINLIKKDLANQFSEDMRSLFAEHSDVLTGTIPNDLDFNKVDSFLDEFSEASPDDPDSFLQFVKRIVPDADYTPDFKRLGKKIQRLDTEIKHIERLKNEFLENHRRGIL